MPLTPRTPRSALRLLLGVASVAWVSLATSAHATCGDAELDTALGEDCDDGGVIDGDGCDSSCFLEDGWTCLQTNLGHDFQETIGTGTSGSWLRSADSYSVTESARPAPSIYVSTLPIEVGPITVNIRSDHHSEIGWVGFVVGYNIRDQINSSAEWILIDWRATPFTTSYEGLAISRVTGTTTESDVEGHTGSVSEIARGTNLGSTGWNGRTDYEMVLSYSTTRVQLWVDGVLEIDETGTFPPGQFSLYSSLVYEMTFELEDPAGLTFCQALDSDGDGLTDPDEINIWGTDPDLADTDADGLDDAAEVLTWGTDPLLSDTDGDGLDDAAEVETWGTDPLVGDTDGDGLDDAAEVETWGTDPLVADTDGDGLDDREEVEVWGTNPLLRDSDDDGLTDLDEVETHGTDPNLADTDGDGLTDGEEIRSSNTNPLVADTDDDGLSDGDEVLVHETDPNETDSDSDGLSDADEVLVHETDPNETDSDSDGLSDGDEVLVHSTNPLDADSDGGGTIDGDEVSGGTDPLEPSDDPSDRDEDGLTDWEEENAWGTDPDEADTDGDGVSDGDEVSAGTDPTEAAETETETETETDPAGDGQDGDSKGGSCSAVPGGGGLVGALVGLAVVGRRRTRR